MHNYMLSNHQEEVDKRKVIYGSKTIQRDLEEDKLLAKIICSITKGRYMVKVKIKKSLINW